MRINKEFLDKINYTDYSGDSYIPFVDLYPGGLELTSETITAIDDYLDIDWILAHVLPGDMAAGYKLARSELGYTCRRQKDVAQEKLAKTEAYQQCMAAIDQSDVDYEQARCALILRVVTELEGRRDDTKPVSELTIEEALAELRAYKAEYVLPPRIAEIIEMIGLPGAGR